MAVTLDSASNQQGHSTEGDLKPGGGRLSLLFKRAMAHFTNEDIYRARIIRETQIKTKMRHYHTPTHQNS